MGIKEKKKKCTECGWETTTLSVGAIHQGCPSCGKLGFKNHASKDSMYINNFLGGAK